MGIFSKKPQGYLGVDIGASGIKVVEFRNDRHRARLLTYGFAEVASDAPDAPLRSASSIGNDLDGIAATLKEVRSKAKAESDRAVAGLPIAAVFNAVISLPRVSAKELPAAIQWEAKKLLPLPIEEMILDWKELGSGNKNAATRVLLTGAPKALVQQYLTVFKSAKIELISLETEALALIRSLVGDDPSLVLILDIGAARTSIVIVDGGVPVFSRSIDVGGQHITRAIAEAIGADIALAEQAKLDMAVMPMADAVAAGLPTMLGQTFATVIQEVKYVVNHYLSQDAQRGRIIEKAILAGGTAFLPRITDFFAHELGLRVFVGDPWARVIAPADLRPALDAIGPQFAVAVGLAMREIT